MASRPSVKKNASSAESVGTFRPKMRIHPRKTVRFPGKMLRFFRYNIFPTLGRPIKSLFSSRCRTWFLRDFSPRRFEEHEEDSGRDCFVPFFTSWWISSPSSVFIVESLPTNLADDPIFSISALQDTFKSGGERGIRTPGGLRLSGFQDRRLKPLDHLSV